MVKKLTRPSRNKTSLLSLKVPPEKVEELRKIVKDIAVTLLKEGFKKGTKRGSGITVLDIVSIAVKYVEIDWFGDGKDEDVEDTIEVLLTRRLPIEEYRKKVDAYYRQQQKEKEKLIKNKDKLIKSVDREIEMLHKKFLGAVKRKEKLQNL